MGCLGGAILAHASNITLQEQNSFTDNFAMMGGGIFAGNSKVMITGTASFHANNASYGGGMGMVFSTLTFDSTAHKFEKPINKTPNCSGNMLLYNNTSDHNASNIDMHHGCKTTSSAIKWITFSNNIGSWNFLAV